VSKRLNISSELFHRLAVPSMIVFHKTVSYRPDFRRLWRGKARVATFYSSYDEIESWMDMALLDFLNEVSTFTPEVRTLNH